VSPLPLPFSRWCLSFFAPGPSSGSFESSCPVCSPRHAQCRHSLIFSLMCRKWVFQNYSCRCSFFWGSFSGRFRGYAPHRPDSGLASDDCLSNLSPPFCRVVNVRYGPMLLVAICDESTCFLVLPFKIVQVFTVFFDFQRCADHVSNRFALIFRDPFLPLPPATKRLSLDLPAAGRPLSLGHWPTKKDPKSPFSALHLGVALLVPPLTNNLFFLAYYHLFLPLLLFLISRFLQKTYFPRVCPAL